jgi:uncharacterized protein (TIGR02001 family)
MKETRQMKKVCIALVAVLLAFGTLVPAALAAIEVEGDAYIGFYDKYVWRGFDLSGSEGVVQGGVDLSTKGFTLSYWTNYQASDDKDGGFKGGEANETDITLDYTASLNDSVSVSVGNIFYHLDGLDDTNELYLGVALNLPLSPSVTVYYDYDEAESDGLFFNASIGHTITLAEKLGVNLGAGVNYNQASDFAVGAYRDWHNYELSVSADYALTDQLSLTPSFLVSSPISDEAKKAIDTETVGGVALTLTF